MNSTVRLRALVQSLILGGSIAGCGDADRDESVGGERTGRAQQEIATERPNGEAQIQGRMRMADPSRLRASYATGMVLPSQCSGTMIGPNLLMTAAHCNAPSGIQFFAYNSAADPTAYRTETFNCSYLLSTFSETDLMLAYCDPNAAGEHPGLKYGYLDFDLSYTSSGLLDYNASKSRLYAGREVYSSWVNPVDNLGVQNQLLYSIGTVGAVDDTTDWFSPAPIDLSRADLGQCSNNNLQITNWFDIWGNPGVSGSAVINSLSNTIIAGPISTAVLDARGTFGLSIVDYLKRAVAQTPNAGQCGSTDPPMVNGSLLSSRWGLSAANFRFMDSNNNGVFEIQERIEQAEGERQRTAYFLNLASGRQNQLWSRELSVISPASGLVMDADSTGWLRQASHTRLNLKARTRYHITSRAKSDRIYSLCLGTACATFSATGGLFKAQGAMLITDATANAPLVAWTAGSGKTQIAQISISEVAEHRLQTADQRAMWEDVSFRFPLNVQLVPTFLTLGRNASTDSDFVLNVRATPSIEKVLVNRHMPFQAGQNRVCWDTRNSALDPATTQPRIEVRDATAGSTVLSMNFSRASNWQALCTAWFNMANANGELWFALGTASTGSYFVDNVRVEHR